MIQLVNEGSGNSYPVQLVPSTTRTQDDSHQRKFLPKATPTHYNSYPVLVIPRTTRAYDDSHVFLFFYLYKTRLFYQVQPVCETMNTQQALATRRESEQS